MLSSFSRRTNLRARGPGWWHEQCHLLNKIWELDVLGSSQPRLRQPGKLKEWAMEFGIFNLMGSRDPEKPTAEVFAEVAEQTRLADELGYAIAWFAEHHFSNYCLCASPMMMVAHCASITKKIRLGTAVVVLPTTRCGFWPRLRPPTRSRTDG
jgi:hypothetical protein